MIYFVFGGAFHGHRAYADTLGCPVVDLNTLASTSQIDQAINAHKNVVFVCDDVGCGVVPMEKEKRDYRDRIGLLGQYAAQKAHIVQRFYFGLMTTLKGEELL